MKRTYLIISTLLILVLLASCGKSSDYNITSIELKLNKLKILDDGKDVIYVIVSDQEGRDVSSRVNIYLDGNIVTGQSISSSESGSKVVYAEYEDLVSNSESITVVEDMGLEYERMVLLEQFTATWCGWCPRAISAVHDAETSGGDVVHVAYHMNGDPYTYYYNQGLAESLYVPSYPTVAANREYFWNLSFSQLNQWYGDVRTGLAVSYTGDLSSIEVSVDVIFGIIYPEDLLLTVYIVEDGLVADQANNYNNDQGSPWFRLGSPVVDYIHNNVMRKTLSDMYGDMIPESFKGIESIYNHVFDGSVTGLQDINNTSAVVFVTYGSGINKGKVINAIVCDYGETTESGLAD